MILYGYLRPRPGVGSAAEEGEDGGASSRIECPGSDTKIWAGGVAYGDALQPRGIVLPHHIQHSVAAVVGCEDGANHGCVSEGRNRTVNGFFTP